MMRLLIALSLLSAAGLHPLEAQDLPGAKKRGDKPVVKILSTRPEKTDVAAGDAVKVVFELEIPKGWHIYAAGKKPLFGLPTKFKFDNAEVAGAIEEPPLKVVNEPGIGDIDYHEGKISVTVPVKLKADVKAGPVTVTGKITYQICDPNVCVDNFTPISFDLKVLANADAPAPGLAPPSAAPPKLEDLKLVAVTASKSEVKVGEPFVVTVELEVPKGYHIFPTVETTTGQPTELKLTGAEPAGKAEGPPTKTHPAEGAQAAYDYYDGAVTLKYPMRLKEGASPGPLDLTGKLKYQICTDKLCRPTSQPVSLKLTVKEGKVEVDMLPPVPNRASGDDLAARNAQNEFEKAGLGGFLLLAVGGGLVSLLMPCVFPILPITVTYFMKQGGGSRTRSAFISFCYCVGIVISFTAIGLLFSSILGADGARRFASNAWVNLAVAGIFFWFTFSLFGLYEIGLPNWLVGGVTNQQRSGASGAFILGVLFSVVTFTCTIPIAGLILGVTASGAAKYRFIGVLAMLAYSITMALPFFFLGIFPALVSRVRKSGGDWLHTVKVTMAFMELGVAFTYLAKADNAAGWGLITRFVMASIWVGVFIFMIMYLLRVFQIRGDEPDPAPAEDGTGAMVRRQIGIGRMLIALGLAVVLVSFVMVGFSRGGQAGWFNLVLPPEFESDVAGPTPEGGRREPVFARFQPALDEAKKASKPVFLEFTGASCTNCQIMKGTVLASAPVKALLSNFVFAELYTDRLENPRFQAGDEENRKILLDRFGISALPAYITLGPDGIERSRIEGKVPEGEFLEFLKKGLQAPSGASASGGN
jgi:thiol:disulfide interchange protein DsbD